MKMNVRSKLQPVFRASVQSGGVLEMTVYEDIGENWWDGSGVSAKTVKKAIDEAGSFDSISVRINSPGGDAFEGVAIYNLLRSQKKPVNVFVDGIAASAASIIAMAGDSITMGHNAMMMVHNAWTFCMGDATEMRKCADVLESISEAIGKTYVSKTGKTSDEIKAIMDAETWMNADQCLEDGFCTAISQPDDDEDDDEAMNLAASFPRLAKLKNVPEQLKAPKVKKAEDSRDSVISGIYPVVHKVEEVAPSNLSQYEARLRLLN